MSRRLNPGADRTAQNQQTLKNLVKLEGNKTCADCKKNKHPRWASWNLGIFICIRCSGIHRGMGTHISRVKSVDLDSWTDEQLQSMLRWGNSRANKYWEAKLAPGHIPADAKIENFIRTKYDSKRWVMDGPIPDPATLGGDGDDDVPLNVVQEKAKLDRSASIKNITAGRPGPPAASRPAPSIDLFGDEPTTTQSRPSTTEPAISARPPPPPSKAPVAPPKQTKPGDSLLGLDFFGSSSQSAPPQRPASAASGMASSGGSQRTDLKQSILSLYAAAPKPQQQQQQQPSNAFGGMTSTQQQPSHSHSQSLAGMGDAFGGLSFSSPPLQQQAVKPSPFAGLASPRSSVASPLSSFGGGSFFDSKPAPVAKSNPPPPPKPTVQRTSSGFGDFGDFTSAAPSTTRSPPPPPASSMGDLFDMGSDMTPAAAPKPTPSAPSYNASAFNLSKPASTNPPAISSSGFNNLSNMDAWGSNDAWSTPDPAPARAAAAPPPPKQTSAAAVAPTSTYKAPATTSMNDDFGGWGSNDGMSSTSMAGASSSKAAVAADDDDFGGWSSAEPVPAPTATSSNSQSQGGKPFSSNSDDLFGNVWG